MFDERTSRLLSEAPSLPTLNANDLPQLLTKHYTEIVSARLKNKGIFQENIEMEDEWPLERIADVYEAIASIESDENLNRAASFVAGTARLIISRGQNKTTDDQSFSPLDRDSVDPSVAAAILFLAAEQYADAFEAINFIPDPNGPYEVQILGLHIKDLISGKVNEILKRATKWRENSFKADTLQNRAFCSLVAVLIEGIELLAANVMSVLVPENVPRKYSSAKEAFSHVISMSYKKILI